MGISDACWSAAAIVTFIISILLILNSKPIFFKPRSQENAFRNYIGLMIIQVFIKK